MTLRVLLTALVLIACTGFIRPAAIEYELRPLMRAEGELEALQMDLWFWGDSDGESTLRLPQSWGGQNELWRSIADLRVVGGAEMRDGDGPGQRILSHRPNARIHVRYRIVQDWEGVPNAEQGNTYRPVVQPGYFHLIGDAALVVPEDLNHDARARLRVRKLPRGWRFASDLEHSGLTVGKLWASVTVGGDFRVLRDAASGVRVAIRGNWSFTDEDFARSVTEIVNAQRRFWGDEPAPYLITVLQLDAPNRGWLSIGGTGLDDAFAFFATPNAEAAQITRTLAHEGLHSWIPGAIGGTPSQGEAAQYWFSEGFTDFYTGRLLVRDGVWTPAEFAADLNDMLRDYARSPVREAPNTRIAEDFWNDPDVRQLPYQRGRLLATLWDYRLRAQGRDMDDVVLEMRARVRSGDPLKAYELVAEVASSYGLDVSEDLQSIAEGGAFVRLPEDVFAPCGRIATREAPVFHRGFDVDATVANGNVITGVDPTLPAYAAGLRDGMALVGRESGEIGNAESEIAYTVRDGDQTRTIRYMPRGHGTLTLQEFVLDEALQGEALARCISVLGGA